MSKSKTYSHAVFAGVAFLWLAQQAFSESNKSVSNQTVLAERSNKVGVRTMIAINDDDVVHVIDIGLQGTSAPTTSANLGTRITKSGGLDLTSVIPKDKVATAARRVSLADGSRMHVVVVWGFSSFPDLLEPYCSLYIFRERDGKTEKLLQEELGPQLDQFIVEDLNKDGKQEILISTIENADESMRVYQIEPDGRITFVQKLDAELIHTISERWMDEAPSIYIEEKSQKSIPGGACYKTAAYSWSKTANRFVLEKTNISTAKELKPKK